MAGVYQTVVFPRRLMREESIFLPFLRSHLAIVGEGILLCGETTLDPCGEGEGRGLGLQTMRSQLLLPPLSLVYCMELPVYPGISTSGLISMVSALLGGAGWLLKRYLQEDKRCLRKFRACRSVAPQSGQTPGQSEAPRILVEPGELAPPTEEVEAAAAAAAAADNEPDNIGTPGGYAKEPGNDGMCNGEYCCIGINV